MAGWTARFESLAGLAAAVRARLDSQARVVALPAGARIFGPGETPQTMLLVLEGSVRVRHVAESGREIVLYRLGPGESCVLTTACLMAGEPYSAEAVAETAVEAVALPRAAFDAALAASEDFRRFVFAAYGARITGLFLTIEDIAFRRVDVRLAERLLALADGDRLRSTHAQLAGELGTAREVVSRQLAEFQRRGWVELARGEIRLADAARLRALSRQ